MALTDLTLLLLCTVISAVLSQRPPQPTCPEASCDPELGDLLIGRENYLLTNSTCGKDNAEYFCIVSHLEDEKKCQVCDSKKPYMVGFPQTYMSHRIENIVSTFRRDWKQRWWQAQNGVENVYIQLDLEAEFRFTHLIMRFKTFRPSAMYIERSYDFGKTWHVYRYFASDCRRYFPGVAMGPQRSISDVICEERYSDISPSTEGEVVFRALSWSPAEATKLDPYSQEVQDLIKMTNLRIWFKKLHTLGDDKLGSNQDVNQKYYYALYDMVVRGSCSCYGHARRCVKMPDQKMMPNMVYGVCECQHNTQGLNCEECKDFYNDLPWKPALGTEINECRACNCNRHSDRCHFDAAVYEATGRVSGGVCDDCQHSTAGNNCEECLPRYYQDPTLPLTDPNLCKACNCDPDGSEHEGECERRTDPINNLVAGRCICKRFVTGRRCDQCQNGYWNLRADSSDGCERCQCFTDGTVGNQGCDKVSGQCTCKRYVSGKNCDQCLANYWGLDPRVPEGCKPCDCDIGGAFDQRCNAQTGQCNCRPHITGRRCDRPMDGYFVPHLDYLIYEAEEARLYQNAKVVVREPSATLSSWTGPGFALVKEGDSIEFTINNVPRSMEYDIVVRYEQQMPDRWDDVRVTVTRPGPVDQRGACANSMPQDDHKGFSMPVGQRHYFITPSSCFEQGLVYKIKFDFNRYKSNDPRSPTASLLIDSIVLMPNPESPPSADPRVNRMREEFVRHRCQENQMSVAQPELPDVCRTNIFSISAINYQQALECECDPQGSRSGVCNPLGGQCECKKNVIGRRCDRCMPGSYQFGNEHGCLECNCDPEGSLDNFCDPVSGQCQCVGTAIVGVQCNRCMKGFFNFPRCQPCQCNGRSDECNQLTGECLQCKDNTGGLYCERCKVGYYGDPRPGAAIGCRPCYCPGGAGSGYQHGDTCDLDTLTSDVKCNCKPGYSGPDCGHCAPGYYGDPRRAGGTCRRCDCNGNIDPLAVGSCDSATGQCLRCLYNTEGSRCERCVPGHYGDATRPNGCKMCGCNFLGTDQSALPCDRVTGQCPCLPNVVGQHCEECAQNYWKMGTGTGCEPCACDPRGANSPKCNEFTGQCDCKPGRGGRDCGQCPANYYGDPDMECHPCNCNTGGSETLQCDHTTGQCVCIEGVAGHKCDRCARGTTGQLPYCVPCGECFDNWDLIIMELKNLTDVLLQQGSDIKITGPPSAFDKEFADMEAKLNRVREILAGSNISDTDFREIEDKIDLLRQNLTVSDSQITGLDRILTNTSNRIEMSRIKLEALNQHVQRVVDKASQLRNNLTEVKELDVHGAYNSTLKSLEQSRSAEQRVDEAMRIIDQSEQVRRQIDLLINTRRAEYQKRYTDNERKLTELMKRTDDLYAEITKLNTKVCDGAGAPCDGLCGGAGCGKCGGLSCDRGATTKAERALTYANSAQNDLRNKTDKANQLLIQVQGVQSEVNMAKADAQMALDEALSVKNESEGTLLDLTNLIQRIRDFIVQDKAKPEDVRRFAEEVLAMSISLTPTEIQDLARQINETVRGLTDIDEILQSTKNDLERATALKRRAEAAEKYANDVLEAAKRVQAALERAAVAQRAAETAIQDANESISQVEGDLDMVESDNTVGLDLTNSTRHKLTDLEQRLGRLKAKFRENEEDVNRAVDEAVMAEDMANKASLDAGRLDESYSRVSVQLDTKYNETEGIKKRAEDLQTRAKTLYEEYYEKLFILREFEKEFRQHETLLAAEEESITKLLERMLTNPGHLPRIRERESFHRTCQN